MVGPMARSLVSLLQATKAVIDSEPWKLDPRCIALPWRSEVYYELKSRPLTIGVIWDDGVVNIHPPIRRALESLISRLSAAGHEILDWEPVGHQDCIKVQVSIFIELEEHDSRVASGPVLHRRRRRRYSTRDCDRRRAVFTLCESPGRPGSGYFGLRVLATESPETRMPKAVFGPVEHCEGTSLWAQCRCSTSTSHAAPSSTTRFMSVSDSHVQLQCHSKPANE